ncbi:MAG: hypothetical protein L3J69_19340 [Desulfobacula sp.]|nr:hypothetical protein [Desulfobacula sp.]
MTIANNKKEKNQVTKKGRSKLFLIGGFFILSTLLASCGGPGYGYGGGHGGHHFKGDKIENYKGMSGY